MRTPALLLMLAAAGAAAAAEPVCRARSGAEAPVVVELYTSEGCSSCPPADRWLSTLKGRPDVLALAFHVDYWDRLGWPDRFASPEITARQWALARRDGRSQVYTPQVRVNGRDTRAGTALPQPAPAGPALALQRDGDRYTVDVAAWTGGATRLEGYWAVLEDDHATRVRAGENAGEHLRHDHVVRLYRPVPVWTAADGLRAHFGVTAGTAAHPRRVAFVVADAASGRPLQALALAC